VPRNITWRGLALTCIGRCEVVWRPWRKGHQGRRA